MTGKRFNCILTINSGSSSVKLALYHVGPSEMLVLSGKIDRIGLAGSHFEMKDAGGKVLTRRELRLPDHETALQVLLDWLHDHIGRQGLDAVGHRVVHGGVEYIHPHIISLELLASLRKLIPLAPGHLPQALRIIETVQQLYPALKQVACFDTAFHRQMPEVAQMYALPGRVRDGGVVRYGFHGLSCEYLTQELRRQAGPEAADGRVIIAHLGNGASMTAVRHGKSVDTTMGFTPAGGLVMSTRSGDLDPGVLVYLLEEEGVQISALNDMVNRKSGLLGVSEISSDMKDLLDKEKEVPRAAAAVNLFCYQAKKFLSALAAALGGLDTLIFTAGVGENAPAVRWRICEGMEFLGIRLDSSRNDANAPIISREDSPCVVRVMRTDEDLMIARQTNDLV
ncbi:MAG: acetate/propionate family kinase [Syntrophobacteraceae bacterium]|jgi:acetate kinase